MGNDKQIKQRTSTEIALWTLQVLMAALFLFAGAMKFLIPADQLAAQSTLPISFLYFIGAAEGLGAFGLVLPGLFRIARGLTSLAAAGLTIIMAGAVCVSILKGGLAAGAIPAIVGVCCALIAYHRAPHRLAPRPRFAN